MSDGEQHHELGPSSLKWVELCPGFRSSDETNVYAEEGTLLHTAVETGNVEGLTGEQEELVSRCQKYVADLVEGADELIMEQRLEISL